MAEAEEYEARRYKGAFKKAAWAKTADSWKAAKQQIRKKDGTVL